MKYAMKYETENIETYYNYLHDNFDIAPDKDEFITIDKIVRKIELQLYSINRDDRVIFIKRRLDDLCPYFNDMISYGNNIHITSFEGEIYGDIEEAASLETGIELFRYLLDKLKLLCRDFCFEIEDITKEFELSFMLKQSEKDLPKISVLNWIGQKNVLTDAFRQMKNKGYLTNSIPETANFLKTNFDCFKNTKQSTIEGMLKNNDSAPNAVPKEEKRIKID